MQRQGNTTQHARIANWRQFQHYSQRNPPWIKLHHETLTSRTWASANDANRVLAIALMLIAARTDNCIPLDPDYVQRIAYLNSKPDFSFLFEVGFIELIQENQSQHASSVPAGASKVRQDARPETETETDTETQTEKQPVAAKPVEIALPPCPIGFHSTGGRITARCEGA